jgi:hypothetical protein
MKSVLDPLNLMEDLAFREWARTYPSMQLPPPSYGSAEHNLLVASIDHEQALLDGGLAHLFDRDHKETHSRTRKAQLEISKCKSIIAPARNLPSDILSHIFSFFPRDNHWFKAKDLLQLGRVSRHWREFVYSTPSLWTYLEFGTDKSPRYSPNTLKAWLERSKDAPLELVIGEWWPEGEYWQLFLREAPRVTALQFSYRPTPDEPWVKFLNNCISLKELNWDAWGMSPIPGLSIALPQLRSLSLNPSLFEVQAPLLEEYDVQFPTQDKATADELIKNIHSSYRGLTKLNITADDALDPSDSAHFRGELLSFPELRELKCPGLLESTIMIVRGSPAIEQLVVCEDFFPHHTPPMPNLTNLELVYTSSTHGNQRQVPTKQAVLNALQHLPKLATISLRTMRDIATDSSAWRSRENNYESFLLQVFRDVCKEEWAPRNRLALKLYFLNDSEQVTQFLRNQRDHYISRGVKKPVTDEHEGIQGPEVEVSWYDISKVVRILLRWGEFWKLWESFLMDGTEASRAQNLEV